jgi:DeoR/GlpR family transcriptional regulator of sugar metabolism
MYIEEFHNSPTGKQIARVFGVSHQAIHRHLKKLVEEERLIKVEGKGWKIPGAIYTPPVLRIVSKYDKRRKNS